MAWSVSLSSFSSICVRIERIGFLSGPLFMSLFLMAAEVRKLAGELMAFEEGPAADALDTGGAKWPYELRRRWRALLEATTQPSEVRMARCGRIVRTLKHASPQAGLLSPCCLSCLIAHLCLCD